MDLYYTAYLIFFSSSFYIGRNNLLGPLSSSLAWYWRTYWPSARVGGDGGLASAGRVPRHRCFQFSAGGEFDAVG